MARERSLDIVIRARDQATGPIKGVSGSLRSFGRQLFNLRGMLMGAIGGAAIGSFLRSSVEAFGRQELAVRNLRSALEELGTPSKTALAEMRSFAAGIQRVTVIGDEAVLEIMQLGASLGRLSGDALKRATKAAIGLSRRLGIDTTAAMRLVARAAVGDTQMLARYGVKLEETLTPQEKFNELLRMGAVAFRLATEEAKTATGQMQQLGNAWGDFKEKAGATILPWLLERGTKAIAGFEDVPVLLKSAGVAMHHARAQWTRDINEFLGADLIPSLAIDEHLLSKSLSRHLGGVLAGAGSKSPFAGAISDAVGEGVEIGIQSADLAQAWKDADFERSMVQVMLDAGRDIQAVFAGLAEPMAGLIAGPVAAAAKTQAEIIAGELERLEFGDTTFGELARGLKRPAAAQTFEARFLTLVGRQSPAVREAERTNAWLKELAVLTKGTARTQERIARSLEGTSASFLPANLS